MVGLSCTIQLKITFVTFQTVLILSHAIPATPDVQRTRAWHTPGLGCFPFARRYLGNRISFFSWSYWDVSLLSVFFDTLYIQIPMLWHKPITGFPIRTSPDQCSFDSSPKLIAVFHVLLHLLAPRHPPCTLCSLTHFLILKRGSNCYPLSIHFSKNYTM